MLLRGDYLGDSLKSHAAPAQFGGIITPSFRYTCVSTPLRSRGVSGIRKDPDVHVTLRAPPPRQGGLLISNHMEATMAMINRTAATLLPFGSLLACSQVANSLAEAQP